MAFLRENSAAIFALAGTALGGGVSFLTGWILSRRDLKLRLAEKLVDRRIDAHESVLALCKEMRVMVSLDFMESPGEVARCPVVLSTSDHFAAWQVGMFEVIGRASHWFRPDLVRELSYLQDYSVNLHMTLVGVPDENYEAIGALIRQDFIDLSSSLEELALKFFHEDIRRLKVMPKREWHKYTRPETEKRLRESALYSRAAEIQTVLSGGQPANGDPDAGG